MKINFTQENINLISHKCNTKLININESKNNYFSYEIKILNWNSKVLRKVGLCVALYNEFPFSYGDHCLR